MLYILAIAASVAADQWLKYWVVRNIELGAWRSFLPGVLRLTYVQNTGAAFGMLANMRWLFVVVTVAFAATAIYCLLKKRLMHPLGMWSLCAICGGAIGNLVDRALHGFVVDMFETEFMNFAVFNLADCFITLGGLAFIVYVLFFHGKSAGKADGDGEADGKGG